MRAAPTGSQERGAAHSSPEGAERQVPHSADTGGMAGRRQSGDSDTPYWLSEYEREEEERIDALVRSFNLGRTRKAQRKAIDDDVEAYFATPARSEFSAREERLLDALVRKFNKARASNRRRLIIFSQVPPWEKRARKKAAAGAPAGNRAAGSTA